MAGVKPTADRLESGWQGAALIPLGPGPCNAFRTRVESNAVRYQNIIFHQPLQHVPEGPVRGAGRATGRNAPIRRLITKAGSRPAVRPFSGAASPCGLVVGAGEPCRAAPSPRRQTAAQLGGRRSSELKIPC